MNARTEPNPPRPRGRSRMRFFLGLCVVLAALFIVFAKRRGGVEVTATNHEQFVIRNVEVRTSAGAYALGDLAPGARASTMVGALGESSASLAWTSSDGVQRVVDADIYFEGSPTDTGMYAGDVDFVVSGGTARATHDVTYHVMPRVPRDAPPPARR